MRNNNSKSHAKIRLTMGQAVVKYLSVQYSRQDDITQRLIRGVFGIFGHGNVSGLAQGLYEYGQDLPYYQPFNEQSQVHTAAGYAKAMRRLSTFACTASVGPGSTNMITAGAGAAINRLPVLLLPSDIYATRYQGNVLQQIEHPLEGDISLNDCFRPFSRFFDRIWRPEMLLTALPEAMRVLTDPAECGPVTLALPQDVQTHAYDYPASFFEQRVWEVDRRYPNPDRIEEAIELLSKAKRPAIIAGGGVLYSNAMAELQKFSENYGIPVSETMAGKGAMKKDGPTYLGAQGVQGNPASASIMRQADLVICIGTRLSDFTTGSRSLFQNPDVRFININVGGQDAFKMGGLPVLADAREALRALGKAAKSAGITPRPNYLKEVEKGKAEWQKQLDEKIYNPKPGEVMTEGLLVKTVLDESKPGDIAVGASSGLLGNVHKLWETTAGRSCLIEFGFSCMGYEIPAGIGTKMAMPKNEVFVFIGDGTYLMQPTEIVTAVQEGLKVTILVAENHGYQCIHAHQLHRAGRSFGNEFRKRDPKTNRLEGEYVQVDFAKNAESLGAKSWYVKTQEALRQALREARREQGPCVIVAATDNHCWTPSADTWWDVGVAEVSNDKVTQKLHEQYEKEREEFQRFYY